MTRRLLPLPPCIAGGVSPCPICPVVAECQYGLAHTTKRPAAIRFAMRTEKPDPILPEISTAGKRIVKKAKAEKVQA